MIVRQTGSAQEGGDMKSAIALLLFFAASTLAGCSGKQSRAISIDGSDTVYPLSKAMADAFHQGNPDIQVTTRFSGSSSLV
jgi:phosphate transport system substrate-binding protein